MDYTTQSTALQHNPVLLEKTRNTVKTYHMFEHGDRIAVGVSGGADSVALLAFLCSLQQELSLTLVVCHLNHRLRGEESDGDEQFVRDLAAGYGLEFCLCSFDAAEEAKAAGIGVEEYSRNRRYAFFEECAKGGKVATAHTLSDAMETVLFNLIRGTGVKGLCGIPRLRGNIIRPLRDCTRGEVEQYLEAIGQPYRTDSTNQSDDYSRNFVRHNIIPAMEQLNPALSTAMRRTMEQLEQQQRMTEQLAAQALPHITKEPFCFYRQPFLELPQPVARLLFMGWLEEVGAQQSERILTLMHGYAKAGSGGVQVAAGVRFVAGKETVCLLQEPPTFPPFSVRLSLPAVGETTEIPFSGGKRLRIACFSLENNEITEKFYNIDLKNLVKCDKIKEHVFAHNPKPEDTICLQGRSHSLYTRYRAGSRGLSASEISRMVVVEDENGIIWAERLGCDELRSTEKQTALIYSFEVLEEKTL
ncbi:MAG: tRNA lysidine(34) synthetase TilS [Angelakisella sp.]